MADDATHSQGCTGKAVFASLAVAQDKARRMRERTEHKLEAYRCRHCHQYHVGGQLERGSVFRSRDRRRQRERLNQVEEGMAT